MLIIQILQRDHLFGAQNKYFALRILRQSRQNFVLVNFFVNKYVHHLQNVPEKRQLVISNICFEPGVLKITRVVIANAPLAISQCIPRYFHCTSCYFQCTPLYFQCTTRYFYFLTFELMDRFSKFKCLNRLELSPKHDSVQN